MARGEMPAVLRDVRTLFDLGTLGGLSDRQLLDRFAGRSDATAQAAFAGLVTRHGPMVLGVCRRALNDPNDVNDAFQATFLILVRKAESVRVEGSLGRWLYGVSRRVSARAKATVAGRLAREVGGVELAISPANDPSRHELGAVLDEEIGRLPERFRAAVVLCDLGGLSHDEAARQLGCAVGTVKSRLSRARERLRSRLTRRGVAPSVLAAGLALHVQMAAAAVPASLAVATASSMVSTGVVSATVKGLAREVLRIMLLTRLRMAAGTAVAIVALLAGVGVMARQDVDPGAQEAQKSDRADPKAQIAKAKDAPAPAEVSDSIILRPFVDRAWYAIFSPDGKSLVTGTNTSGGIRIYNAETHGEVGLLDGEAKTRFACAAFSPDGKLLVSSGGSRVLVWDFAERKLLTQFVAHGKEVRSLAFTPDGKTLVSAGVDTTVKFWNVETWEQRPIAFSADEPVFCVTFSPNGKTLAIATGEDREARSPRVSLYDYDANSVRERVKLAAAQRGPAWTLAFSPDGKALASSSFDPMVKLWAPSSGRELTSLPLAGGNLAGGLWARGLAFSPDGKTLAAGLSDGSIALWDVASGRRTATLRGHEQHLFSVAFSPDGKTLASASKDGSVRLWDLAKALP
ncbi:sigma-70 family RNA polymerase sigma factor [Singulisphaera sp. Ch08]|uniref:Sigma-70 family RNA polymerase sigma factor n=1 Tax=Singulisphaera sp. Ch08 TaxID=3120278 RepID=A0AAU7C896_9BACT